MYLHGEPSYIVPLPAISKDQNITGNGGRGGVGLRVSGGGSGVVDGI